MSLIKHEPGFLSNLEPFFSHWFDDFLPSRRVTSQWSGENLPPRINVSDQDKAYCVTADLPGVAKDDIQLSMQDGVLTIKAEVQQEKEEQKDQIIRRERYTGQYFRQMNLGPNASENGVEADFINGVLKVTVPKIEASSKKEPTTIKVY